MERDERRPRAACALADVMDRRRLLMPALDGADLSPAPRWPDPQLGAAFEPARGPVLISVEYEIEPSQAQAFARAMRALGAIRRRDGAIRWPL
jgi:hypothetical protein